VENGAAFSAWAFIVKRALTPTISPRERGLFERGVCFRRERGGSA